MFASYFVGISFSSLYHCISHQTIRVMTFEEAVAKSKTLTSRPSNDILLEMYGLYKQATDGDVQGERPGGFDIKAMAKYDAWAKLKGKKNEEAQVSYISLVDKLANS